MTYIENPKTKGSGILCAIPQTGECPVRCAECFFQSGRSYLEPLAKNLPNCPRIDDTDGYVVRMNDGNDSNVERDLVVVTADHYQDSFFNTSVPKLNFPGPVVLTVNPACKTDKSCHYVDPCPPSLMFVRIRTNTWNLHNVVIPASRYYAGRGVPVVLTFMAYYNEEPDSHDRRVVESDRISTHDGMIDCGVDYEWRKRTLNAYWVITEKAWNRVVSEVIESLEPKSRQYLYTCGKDANTHSCARCGNCLREYFAAKERMKSK